jgi:hypothetical protein
MTQQELSAKVSLPRPQRPLPTKEDAKGRFESLDAMIKDAWKDDEEPPSHAWVRYSLSAGTPLATFSEAFRGLSNIKHAFGRRVFVGPVRMDHHEIDLADFDHMVNPESGQYEIEANWRKKRCDGGTHLFFAVASTANEGSRDHSEGLHALEALESLIRVTLGAMTVVQTRRTLHVDLSSGEAHDVDKGAHFRLYGPEELPHSDTASIDAAVELAEKSATLPATVIARLSLGMRWANIAFKTHDLLAYWTAIEIVAGCQGQAVYGVVTQAYGHSKKKDQAFAKELGLRTVCQLRGKLVHEGMPIHIDPQGESYLNALVHDIARHVAGLPCLKLAQRALGQHRVADWIREDLAI